MLQIGSKFNRLTVLEFNHKDKRHRCHYLCQCDCGNKKVIHGAHLTSGNTKSKNIINQSSTGLPSLPQSQVEFYCGSSTCL